MRTRHNVAREEEIFRFKQDNECTLEETAKAFHMSQRRVQAICEKWEIIERRKTNPLYLYVGENTRIYHSLWRAGIRSVEVLQALPRETVERVPNIGKAALNEIYSQR